MKIIHKVYFTSVNRQPTAEYKQSFQLKTQRSKLFCFTLNQRDTMQCQPPWPMFSLALCHAQTKLLGKTIDRNRREKRKIKQQRFKSTALIVVLMVAHTFHAGNRLIEYAVMQQLGGTCKILCRAWVSFALLVTC